MKLEKYKGIIPAFYACYDKNGDISGENTQKFAQYLLEKGVKGLYVGGSSGECIYQSVEDRKITLENVMKAVGDKLTIIAHVACNNTKDSIELAKHAESLGVDAIAAIPPIYFKLPDYAIADYWNDISSGAPKTDFIIYNIPQLAGVALSKGLYTEMLKNPRVIGVKNSSMPVQDIQIFKSVDMDKVVFNGPDEQLVSGLSIGADGGIGGTYAVMPELYLKITQFVKNGEIEKANKIQYDACEIIYKMCTCKGNLYATMKEIIRKRDGIDCGSVRKPLFATSEYDYPIIEETIKMINTAIKNI